MKQARWLSEFSSLSEYTRLYPTLRGCLARRMACLFCTRWKHSVVCVMTLLTDEKSMGKLSKIHGYAMIGTFENTCQFQMPLLDLSVYIQSCECWPILSKLTGLSFLNWKFTTFSLGCNVYYMYLLNLDVESYYPLSFL